VGPLFIYTRVISAMGHLTLGDVGVAWASIPFEFSDKLIRTSLQSARGGFTVGSYDILQTHVALAVESTA